MTEGMESTHDLGVVHKTDLGSPEFAPPDENVDVRSVLCKVYEGETDVRCNRGRYIYFRLSLPG